MNPFWKFALATLFTASCIPKPKPNTVMDKRQSGDTKAASVAIDTDGVTQLFNSGLTLNWVSGNETIQASYLNDGGPFQDADPESKRKNFTLTKVSSTELINALKSSRHCPASTKILMADCGEMPIILTKASDKDSRQVFYLKPTDCMKTYQLLCEDQGLSELVEKAFSEIPKDR